MSYKLIPMVDAGDFPQDVEDWCVERDIPTHYDDGIASFKTTHDNPLNNWLKEQGYTTDEVYTHVAIRGT